MNHPDKTAIADAVAAFEDMGGDVWFDDDGKVESVDVSDVALSSRDLRRLEVFPHLRELTLWDCGIRNTIWRHLRGAAELETLALPDSKITDAGLKNLAHFTDLEFLAVHNTKVDENGLVHLEGMQELNTLYLCFPVSKKGIASLKKLKGLDSLYIGDHGGEESRELVEESLDGVEVY